MPVNSIITAPASGALVVAYRPVVLQVDATATAGGTRPPYVVCDVYFKGVFYKSIIRTVPDSVKATGSTFTFNVSDALQELLQPDLPTVSNAVLLSSPHMSGRVFCRFRASDVDSVGLTVEEGPKPKPATQFTPAEAGGGKESPAFFVINSALQHADNQNLAHHLASFRTGTWHPDAYPLTHRTKYTFCEGSADHFPFIFAGPCQAVEVALHWRNRFTGQWNDGGPGEDTNACETIIADVDVAGKNVTANMASSSTFFVKYRTTGTVAWTEVGFKSGNALKFTVPDAGNYDISIAHYCDDNISAAPWTGTFSVEASAEPTAWRGIEQYCMLSSETDQPIYVKVELRNAAQTENFFPNSEHYYQRNVGTKGDLYLLFFSDAAMLTPYTPENITAYYKVRTKRMSQQDGSVQISESVISVPVSNASSNAYKVPNGPYTGNEAIYYYDINNGNVFTGNTDNYDYSYSAYPSARLESGNTGYQGFATLEEYVISTGNPTGNKKPNAESDTDYAAPALNPSACPTGVPDTMVTYGYKLDVMKVEFRTGSATLYADTASNTYAGGQQFVVPVPKDQPAYIAVKARTLDTGNTTGKLKVLVGLTSGSTQSFEVPNNIETTLPGTFTGISYVNISNY